MRHAFAAAALAISVAGILACGGSTPDPEQAPHRRIPRRHRLSSTPAPATVTQACDNGRDNSSHRGGCGHTCAAVAHSRPHEYGTTAVPPTHTPVAYRSCRHPSPASVAPTPDSTATQMPPTATTVPPQLRLPFPRLRQQRCRHGTTVHAGANGCPSHRRPAPMWATSRQSSRCQARAVASSHSSHSAETRTWCSSSTAPSGDRSAASSSSS